MIWLRRFGDHVLHVIERPLVDGRPEFEIRSAQPENAPFKVLARDSGICACRFGRS